MPGLIAFFRASAAALAMAGLLVLLSGCAATAPLSEGPKFWEEPYADVILRHSSDQAVFMIRPDAHQGAFRQVFSREDVCRVASSRTSGRDLAVVVLNYFPMPEMERQARQQWVESLGRLNYRRVVFLRGSESSKINGLRVVGDVLIASQAPVLTHGEFARMELRPLAPR